MASSSHEVVTLNIGGTMYTSTATTLLCPAAADSMLARLVSLHLAAQHSSKSATAAAAGSTDNSTANNINNAVISASLVAPCLAGALFIDRDGPLFAYVLSYLRNGGDLVPPADITASRQLLQEAKYYGIEGMVALLQQHLLELKQQERSRHLMNKSTFDWQRQMQGSMWEQEAAFNEIKECLSKFQKVSYDEIPKCLSNIEHSCGLLHDMHRYLTPQVKYQPGKRSGPNLYKPYTLRDDLSDIEEMLQQLLDK